MLSLAGSLGLEVPRTSFVRLCLRGELEPGVVLGSQAAGVVMGTLGVSGIISDPQLE